MNSSDFSRFLSGRSSVREFSETPLNQAEIDFIISCAGTAPSAGNLEAWDVVVVTDAELRLDLAESAFGQQHVSKVSRTLRGLRQLREVNVPIR